MFNRIRKNHASEIKYNEKAFIALKILNYKIYFFQKK